MNINRVSLLPCFTIVPVITRVSRIVDGLVGLEENVTRQKGHFADLMKLALSKFSKQLDVLGLRLFWIQVSPGNLTRCSKQILIQDLAHMFLPRSELIYSHHTQALLAWYLL